MDGKNFVRVVYLTNRLALIAVPEENRSSLAACNKFKFVISTLRHTEQRAVSSLVTVDSLLLLKIIGRNGSVSGAGMDEVWLVQVGEESHDVFLLIYKS